MIQDWGYDYLYLKKPGAITKVNLQNHSYHDVLGTPMQDFELTTIEEDKSTWWKMMIEEL